MGSGMGVEDDVVVCATGGGEWVSRYTRAFGNTGKRSTNRPRAFLSFPSHLAPFSSYSEAANRQPTNIFVLIGRGQVIAIGSKPIGRRTWPRAVFAVIK